MQKIIDRDPYLVLPEKQNRCPFLNKEDILNSSPEVKYLCKNELPVLSKSNKTKDKALKSPLIQFFKAEELKKLITLNLLSSSIELYTEDLKLWKELKPRISKQMKK